MDHPELELFAVITLAGWMRRRGFAAKSSLCCRWRHGAVLRCSICAKICKTEELIGPEIGPEAKVAAINPGPDNVLILRLHPHYTNV